MVQVQKGAPAKLLIGTYLLPKLGFLFLRTELGDGDVDFLGGQRRPREREEGWSTLMPSEMENGMAGTVCLLQAVRLSGRHSKLVRARVSGMKRHSLLYFELNVELDEREVKMPKAAVEMDEGGCVMVMMENHGWGPVEVDRGQVIGQVQVAKLCQVEPDNHVPVDGVVCGSGDIPSLETTKPR